MKYDVIIVGAGLSRGLIQASTNGVKVGEYLTK